MNEPEQQPELPPGYVKPPLIALECRTRTRGVEWTQAAYDRVVAEYEQRQAEQRDE